MFEICKIEPNPALVANNPNQASAFNAYYKVSLKPINIDIPFPSSISLNYLAFSGKISVNGFTSRINKELTDQFSKVLPDGSPNPSFSKLAYDTENGEVSWTLGQYEPCIDPNQSNESLALHPSGAIGTESVYLFTIVLDGVPGDIVKWVQKNGTISDCANSCSSGVLVNECSSLNGQLGLPITFPTLPACSPSQGLAFEYGTSAGDKFIRVRMKNLQPGIQNINKLDGVIHLDGSSLGTPDLDYDVTTTYQSPSPISFYFNKRKNADGSYDVYFKMLSTTWQPSATDLAIFDMRILGHTNLSQGGSVDCSLTCSRSADVLPCSLKSNPTTVTIPGYPQCPNKLSLVAVPQYGPNCSVGVKYSILTGFFGAPVNFSSLKIVLRFQIDKLGNGPGTIVTSLPDAATYGITTFNPITGAGEYKYERNTPVSVQFGDYITIPFTLTADCVEYYVQYAEGIVDGASNPCSFASNVTAGDNPACTPEIIGTVQLPGLNDLDAPKAKVTLKSNSSPFYEIYNEYQCVEGYSFCPSQNYAPFYLQVFDNSFVNHCACGVTAYDLILISRHIIGDEMLQKPYPMIAANADETPVGPASLQDITDADIQGIRACLISNVPNFGPRSSPSWRYFKDTYVHNNALPLSTFPYTDSDKSQVPVPNDPNGTYSNFTAVKMGDVDQSCRCGSKKALDFANVQVHYKTLENGSIQADFKAGELPFIAAQTAFRFDASQFKLKHLQTNTNLGITDECFGLQDKEEGIIRFIWFAPDGFTPIAPQEGMFSVVFERLNTDLSGAENEEMPIFIPIGDLLDSKLYNVNGEELILQIVTNKLQEPLSMIVQPNPVLDYADLHVFSKVTTSAHIRVEDQIGSVLFEQKNELQAGENTLRIHFPRMVPGAYFIVLNDGQTMVRRPIIKSGQ
jgi:hypothetical protein